MIQPSPKTGCASRAYPQFKVNQTPAYANQKRKRRKKRSKRKYLMEPNWI